MNENEQVSQTQKLQENMSIDEAQAKPLFSPDFSAEALYRMTDEEQQILEKGAKQIEKEILAARNKGDRTACIFNATVFGYSHVVRYHLTYALTEKLHFTVDWKELTNQYIVSWKTLPLPLTRKRRLFGEKHYIFAEKLPQTQEIKDEDENETDDIVKKTPFTFSTEKKCNCPSGITFGRHGEDHYSNIVFGSPQIPKFSFSSSNNK